MGLFTNLFGTRRMRIRFDQMLDTHTVTLDNTSIIFVGSRDKCLDFVEGHLDQILESR